MGLDFGRLCELSVRSFVYLLAARRDRGLWSGIKVLCLSPNASNGYGINKGSCAWRSNFANQDGVAQALKDWTAGARSLATKVCRLQRNSTESTEVRQEVETLAFRRKGEMAGQPHQRIIASFRFGLPPVTVEEITSEGG